MAGATYNVDNLRKRDLVFELRSRGVDSSGSTDTLRAELRSVLKNKITADGNKLAVEDWAKELAEANITSNFLADDFANLESSSATREVQRFVDRAQAFGARLEILRECVDEGDTDSAEELGKMVQVLAQLNAEFSTFQASLRAVNPPTPQPGPKVVQQLAIPNFTCKLADQPVVVPEPQFSLSYARLAHPAEKILRALPICDGFDVDKLLALLKGSVKLIKSFCDLRSNILSLLIPQTSGSLNSCLIRHLGATNSFDDFHAEVIELFIPVRQLTHLKQNLYYRCQGADESLPNYIVDIREAAAVLRLPDSEGDIVETILDGISPRVRSALVFCEKAKTFAELDRLCSRVMNVEFADRERAGPSRSSEQFRGRFQPLTAPVKCHECGEKGHIRPRCPKLGRFNVARPSGTNNQQKNM